MKKTLQIWPGFTFAGVEVDVRLQKKDVFKTARLFPSSPVSALLQAVVSRQYLYMYGQKFFDANSSLNRIEQSVMELAMVC